MTIHFICTGNIYRSRLAEAYCASRGVPGLRVFSSGTGTALNGGVPIARYAAQVLKKRGLEGFGAPSWQPTTKALVEASDVLVFMETEHYQFCERWIEPARQKVEIWEIADVDAAQAAPMTQQAEETFERIKQRTDALLAAMGTA